MRELEPKLFVVNKTNFFIAVLFLFVIKIDSLSYFLPDFSNLLNITVPLIIFICMSFLIVISKNVSPIFILIIIFFSLLIFSTLITNRSALAMLGRSCFRTLALCSITEYYMRKKSTDFLEIVRFILCFLVLIDLVTILLYPEGLYSSSLYTNCWFLGYKTSRLSMATLPVIMFSAILSVKQHNKLDIKFWFIALLATVDTSMSENTGGVVTILIMLALLIVYRLTNKKNAAKMILSKILNFKLLFFLILSLTFLINIYQNVSFFEPFIVGVLEKDLTFTGRTEIWNLSIHVFLQSPFIGNGYIQGDVFSRLVGFREATQPHSLFLSILVYTGIVGLALFLLLINKTFSYTGKGNYNSLSDICAIYIIAILIHGIISMHLFSQFLYPAMLMLYYLSEKGDNIKLG